MIFIWKWWTYILTPWRQPAKIKINCSISSFCDFSDSDRSIALTLLQRVSSLLVDHCADSWNSIFWLYKLLVLSPLGEGVDRGSAKREALAKTGTERGAPGKNYMSEHCFRKNRLKRGAPIQIFGGEDFIGWKNGGEDFFSHKLFPKPGQGNNNCGHYKWNAWRFLPNYKKPQWMFRCFIPLWWLQL